MAAADSQSLHGVPPPPPRLLLASVSTTKASDALPLPLYLTNTEDEEEENVLLCKEDARTIPCRQALDGSLPLLPSYEPNITAQKLFDEKPVRVTTEEDARKPYGQAVDCSFPSLPPRSNSYNLHSPNDASSKLKRKVSPTSCCSCGSEQCSFKAASSAPPPTPVQKGIGFGATIVDGIGWGVGTAMAHRAADAIVGPRVIKHETVASSEPAASTAPAPNTKNLVNSDACGGQSKALSDSLTNYGNDISKCQFYIDMLKECRRSSGAALDA
ncbi:glutamine amidotransferase [Hibiscus syriacus]|uniref:Glutamine amidotransferase n=1 Tax=Hibiscus syriacus TaxID=106335 RepID=A0A6A3BG11_HIBSY|nr:glutamine amidotransferase [Hibiscus syriacus]